MKRILFVLVVVLIALNDSRGGEPETLFAQVRALAQSGNLEAQYHIGMMYNNGMGVSQDPNKAFEWFSKAATGGDPLAAYKVGCYYDGQFPGVVAVDLNKAVEYKLIAAKAGYSIAQSDVGIAYYKQGNVTEALGWWRMAAGQGYDTALYYLSIVYRDGKVVPKDSARAFAYFKLSQSLSGNQIGQEVQAVLDKFASTMSSEELAKAEEIVSSWKSQPTSLTQRAKEGVERARKLAGTGHN